MSSSSTFFFFLALFFFFSSSSVVVVVVLAVIPPFISLFRWRRRRHFGSLSPSETATATTSRGVLLLFPTTLLQSAVCAFHRHHPSLYSMKHCRSRQALLSLSPLNVQKRRLLMRACACVCTSIIMAQLRAQVSVVLHPRDGKCQNLGKAATFVAARSTPSGRAKNRPHPRAGISSHTRLSLFSFVVMSGESEEG